MKQEQYKRSHEPVAWFLFGFGGMAIAFALPVLLVLMIIAGFTGSLGEFRILEAMKHWWGAGAIFLIILGIAFHSMHRIYFSLHDLKCNTGLVGQIILYGLATAISLASATALCIYYFQ